MRRGRRRQPPMLIQAQLLFESELAIVLSDDSVAFTREFFKLKYGLEVPSAVRSLRMSLVRTSFESPWQNGIAERWVGSCRRELLDHIIAVDERYLKRCSLNTSATTMTTARILGSGRKRRTVEPLPERLVACYLMSDSAGCIIVTIGRPDPKRMVLKPQLELHPYIYAGRSPGCCQGESWPQ
jgi:hypothetical protein